MVQYWEAVASGTPLPAVSAEEAAAAEAYANAAIAAAEAAMAAAAALAEEEEEQQQQQQQQQQVEQDAAAVPLDSPAPEPEAAEVQLGGADACVASAEPTPAATPIQMLPEATPIRFAGGLPAGDAATPAAGSAAGSPAATPARCTLTPLNFAAPPPTPAEGVDPQQAQQLHQLAVSMAAAAVTGGSAAASVAGTPASAQRTASRLPATPLGTPVGSTAALAVTPLALSALRARLGGSAGGVQDAVRSRLARLKADLAAAQAKLATVDQVGGLAMGIAQLAAHAYMAALAGWQTGAYV